MITELKNKSRRAFQLNEQLQQLEHQISVLNSRLIHHSERLNYIQRKDVFLEVSGILFDDKQQLMYLQEEQKTLKKEFVDYEGVPSTVTQIYYQSIRSTKIIQLILDQPGMFCVGRLVCKEWNDYLISKVRPNIVLPKMFTIKWHDWPTDLKWGKKKYCLPDNSQQFYDFIVKCILVHGCGHNLTLAHMYVNGTQLFQYDLPLGRAWHFVDHIVPWYQKHNILNKLDFERIGHYLPPDEVLLLMQACQKKEVPEEEPN